MPEKEINNSQVPFFIPREVMELLRGKLANYELEEGKLTPLVAEGGFLWGVDNLDVGKGVFNHSCKVARKAYFTAIALKEKSKELGDGRYTSLDENEVAVLGLLHDIVKLHSGSNPKPAKGEWIKGRENLSQEQKQALGLKPDYREISAEADEFAVNWVEKSGLSDHLKQLFKEVVVGHDFPISEEAIKTSEQMLIQVADYTVAQDFSTVRVRWNDVADRWVKSAVANWDKFENEGDTVEIIKKHSSEFVYKEGQKPRIEPERLSKAVEIVEKAATEIYGYLGITEEEMNQRCQEEPAWEAALRAAWEQDYSLQKNQLRSDTPYSDLLRDSAKLP